MSQENHRLVLSNQSLSKNQFNASFNKLDSILINTWKICKPTNLLKKIITELIKVKNQDSIKQMCRLGLDNLFYTFLFDFWRVKRPIGQTDPVACTLECLGNQDINTLKISIGVLSIRVINLYLILLCNCIIIISLIHYY